MFSRMRDGVTDFGITTLPSCRCQRSTTWAADLPWRAAISADHGVGEQLAALAERRPGLGEDAVLRVELAQFGLLQVRVQLDLVDRGHDTGLVDQPPQVRGLEVRDADRADPALLPQLHERLPGVDVELAGRRRPVDQVQVERVELELVQRLVERTQGRVVALVGVPQLGRDEQLFAGDAGQRRPLHRCLPRCRRSRRCRCCGSPTLIASVTAGTASASGTCHTPKPSWGISTPLLSFTMFKAFPSGCSRNHSVGAVPPSTRSAAPVVADDRSDAT